MKLHFLFTIILFILQSSQCSYHDLNNNTQNLPLATNLQKNSIFSILPDYGRTKRYGDTPRELILKTLLHKKALLHKHENSFSRDEIKFENKYGRGSEDPDTPRPICTIHFYEKNSGAGPQRQ